MAPVTVLVVAILYRRAKFRDSSQQECDQFSDIVSTSSRSSGSTASTISSTRSTRSQVPDKMDIISFNAEGNLRKSVSNNDDLKLKTLIVFSRLTTAMICTAWIATTSWVVWRTYQYKYDNFFIKLHYQIIFDCSYCAVVCRFLTPYWRPLSPLFRQTSWN